MPKFIDLDTWVKLILLLMIIIIIPDYLSYDYDIKKKKNLMSLTILVQIFAPGPATLKHFQLGH